MNQTRIEIYPLYDALWKFWALTLQFVEEYVENYYNDDKDDDSKLLADSELTAFYETLLKLCGIPSKHGLKKYNLQNILTQSIVNMTLWHNHLSTSVSFQYAVDPTFNGLKINKDLKPQNSVQNYLEYAALALCQGWNLMDFQGMNVMLAQKAGPRAPDFVHRTLWTNVLLADKHNASNTKIFKQYFEKAINLKMGRSLAPFYGANPAYFGCSIMS